MSKPFRSAEVNAYIRAQPPQSRRALESLRSCAHQAAPDAVELTNYNTPAFALIEGGKRYQQVMMAGYARRVGSWPEFHAMGGSFYEVHLNHQLAAVEIWFATV